MLAVITPVKNEPKRLLCIAKQLLSQTFTPKLWVIVDDGSTDTTANVISELERKHEFISSIYIPKVEGYNEVFRYGSLIRTGLKYAIDSCESLELCGILDVDVKLGKNYYKQIVSSFTKVPKLGVASGLFYESENGTTRINLISWICGATMVFNRECLEDIRGFPTCPCPDTVALLKVANRRWRIGILSSTYAIHLRANKSFNKYLKLGIARYILGYHPLNVLLSGPFEALKNFSISPLGFTAGYLLGALRTNEIADEEIYRYFHESFFRSSCKLISNLPFCKKINLDPLENAVVRL